MRPSYNEPGKQTDRQPARKISDQWVAEKVLLHCTQRSREGMSATKPGTFEKSPQTKRNALDAWWTWCHNSGVTEPHSVPCCLRVRLVLCVMHKLGDKDADKPGRREACRVISTVTQYQHWKLKNAIHVNALKKQNKKNPHQPPTDVSATRSRTRQRWFVRLCWPTPLVNTKPVKACDIHRMSLDQCHLPLHCIAFQTVRGPLEVNKLVKQTPSSPQRRVSLSVAVQPQWTKTKRGSGTAFNHSCIKRISMLKQLANAA